MWNEHILQGDLFAKHLLKFCDSQWLINRRMSFVNSAGSVDSRNIPYAGRTGTQGALGGRPQPSWEKGIALAKLCSVSQDSDSSNVSSCLSVETRVFRAHTELIVNSVYFSFAPVPDANNPDG